MSNNKKTVPKEIKEVCENCIYNVGIGIMGWMYHCANLDYCVSFGWRKSEAREKKKKKKVVNHNKSLTWNN